MWKASRFHHFTLPPPQSFAGQTVLITGANTGLGRESARASARHVLALGADRVILGVRNDTKGDAARNDIAAFTDAGHQRIDVWTIDLESFQSVRQFADRARRYVNDDGGHIDVAIMNAGLTSGEFNLTADGWERQLQVNGLSTALLSLRLLALLLSQTRSRRPGRGVPHLVIVASDMHLQALFCERSAAHSLDALNDRAQWAESMRQSSVVERCAVTKLLDIYMTLELAEMVSQMARSDHDTADAEVDVDVGHRAATPPVIVNCVTPGFCQSDLLTREKAPTLLKVIQWLTTRSCEVGAILPVDAAVHGAASHGQWLENEAIADPGRIVTSPDGVQLWKMWKEMLQVLAQVDGDVPGLVNRVSSSG